MRSFDRLNDFYNELLALHQKYICDWRFGQFIMNFCVWHKNKYRSDIFYLEEDICIKRIKEYLVDMDIASKEELEE